MKRLGAIAVGLAIASLAPAARAQGPGTIVSLTFDDTLGDQFDTVRDLLASHGMHATFYVNSGRIDQPGYMTLDQIRRLASDGNEIGGHTVHHVQLPKLPVLEQARQICNDRANLLSLGFRVTDFAYPHGSSDDDTVKAVGDCGYDSARVVGGLACSGCASVESVPPAAAMLIRSPSSIVPATTLDQLEGYVTAAEPEGGWVPLVFHHACDGCNALSIAPSTLTAFLDWIAPRAAQGTVMKTVAEVVGGDVKPAVVLPLPAAPGIGVEAAPNGSFEIDHDDYGDGIPDCWQTGGSATIAGAVIVSGDARDGKASLAVTSNGDTARLVVRQDMGACAATAVPGDAYAVSVWTKGASPPRLVAYVRDPLGAWRYLGSSPEQPATADWAQATWTTAALPSDATGVSVGIELTSAGTLTIDSFSLRDVGVPPPEPAKGSKAARGGCSASPQSAGGEHGALAALALAIVTPLLRSRRARTSARSPRSRPRRRGARAR